MAPSYVVLQQHTWYLFSLSILAYKWMCAYEYTQKSSDITFQDRGALWSWDLVRKALLWWRFRCYHPDASAASTAEVYEKEKSKCYSECLCSHEYRHFVDFINTDFLSTVGSTRPSSNWWSCISLWPGRSNSTAVPQGEVWQGPDLCKYITRTYVCVYI